MQFKKVGQRIQVLRYEGYDKDRRRAIVKMVGSVHNRTFEPTVGLIESLTDDERVELDEFIERKRKSSEDERRWSDLRLAVNFIAHSAEALAVGGEFDLDGMTEARATAIWTATRALQKSMVSAGFPPPGRRKKNSVSTDPRQQSIPEA